MRKKQKLLLEIFIWILLLGGLIFFGVNIVVHHLNKYQSYQVIFKDIDGLIVGSPVRMMGIQVGHITEVTPTNDEVFITFVITENNLQIPKGSIVSVQFTGLAGSKSLEIEPPKTQKKGGPFLEVNEPIRVSSLMGIQTRISESILQTAQSVLAFFGENQPKVIGQHIKQVTINTGTSVSQVKGINTNLNKTSKQLSENIKNMNVYFTSRDKDFSSLGKSLNDETLNKNLKETITSLNSINQGISATADSWKSNNYSTKLKNNLQSFDKKIDKLNLEIHKFKEKKTDLTSEENEAAKENTNR